MGSANLNGSILENLAEAVKRQPVKDCSSLSLAIQYTKPKSNLHNCSKAQLF